MNESWLNALSRHGALFENGRVVHFGDFSRELAAADGATVLCDLSHEGLILVTGEDAANFLHAQLTNDVLALADSGAQWNGWCSPKGRLLATFLLWKGKQGYFLALPRALQAAIQKRLQMFVLRSKVKLEDVGAQWIHFGLAGPAAEAMIQGAMGAVPEAVMTSVHTDHGRVIRISLSRFVIIANAENAPRLWNAFAENAVKAGAAAWDRLSIREGVLQVLPETQDAFVPQMANFELIGGVSFKKGCYPGQEIVARTQYRGILKRRMVRVRGAGDSMPKPGDTVYAAEFGDQAAGAMANVAPDGKGGFDALVVAQIESINAGSLHFGSLDGPVLTIERLPYEIPA